MVIALASPELIRKTRLEGRARSWCFGLMALPQAASAWFVE